MNDMDNVKDTQSLKHPRRRGRVLAVELCVKCGKDADQFTELRSSWYFGISGYCQICQDIFFSEDMSDEG